MALDMPDLEMIAAPLVAKGQLVTLTGHPGHAKTTFMTGMFAHLAIGRAYGPITLETEGLFYLVSAEDFQGSRDRILAEAARMRLDADERELLNAGMRWMQVEHNVGARAIRDAIKADARGANVVLVGVDTGPAMFCGEDENDNVALRNYVETYNCMSELDGRPGTIINWHPSKGAGSDRLDPRGASAIKGTIDSNLTIWREDDRITLSYTKIRGAHFEPIEGRIVPVEMEAAGGRVYTAPTIVFDQESKHERSDARETREAILRRLYVDRHDPPTVRALALAIGKPASTVGGHLTTLAQSKPALVQRDPVTERYTLTRTGEARAREILCPTY
ncbi:MAG: AAA family ATPase [Burkholderiales bacterium]